MSTRSSIVADAAAELARSFHPAREVFQAQLRIAQIEQSLRQLALQATAGAAAKPIGILSNFARRIV